MGARTKPLKRTEDQNQKKLAWSVFSLYLLRERFEGLSVSAGREETSEDDDDDEDGGEGSGNLPSGKSSERDCSKTICIATASS